MENFLHISGNLILNLNLCTQISWDKDKITLEYGSKKKVFNKEDSTQYDEIMRLLKRDFRIPE